MTPLRSDADHDRVCASNAQHLLVVAPPGTGKTCLSVRLAGTIATTLDETERVLLITFSNQARVRLDEEVTRQLSPSTRARVEVTNYHRFFWRAVRSYRRALRLPPRIEVGSLRRRLAAFEGTDPQVVKQLRKRDGLLEGLAEQAFECFRDDRTPEPDVLARLLSTVDLEHQAGRLVFDDLGALTWRLLVQFPSVEAAYRARYPVVIADEHQDASELQDALVRRLARRRLVVLADPMQLIYGFRGSRAERLERHETECNERHELRTPHRWHHDPPSGIWLQAVRARLQGRDDSASTPPSLRVIRTAAYRGFNAMKPDVRFSVSRAFASGANTIAVLAPTNDDVAELRTYLTKQNLFPRQLGGDDFEEARSDIERLPLYTTRREVAQHAIDRLEGLVPTLPAAVVTQMAGRLRDNEVHLRGNCGEEAQSLLRALVPIYSHGPAHYVTCLAAMLDECRRRGHHLPRVDAVRAIRDSAEMAASSAATSPHDVEAVMGVYAERVVVTAHTAPRLQRGLYVMTAHQAKGKEFDVVVLVNVSERHFPDTEEKRRLFYVAITRGARKWIVIAPDQRASPLIRHLAP